MSKSFYLHSAQGKPDCGDTFNVTCDTCVLISATEDVTIPVLRRVGEVCPDTNEVTYKPFTVGGEPVVLSASTCPLLITLPGYYKLDIAEGTPGDIFAEEVECKPGNFSQPTPAAPVVLDPESIAALCDCINTSLEMTLNVELTPENKDLLAACIAEALEAADLTFTLDNVMELADAICAALAPKLEALGVTITDALEVQTAALLLAVTSQTLELCEKFEDLNQVLCDKIEEQTAALCEKFESQLEPFKTTCGTGSQSVSYTNSDNATEMTVSVGGNGDIKIDAGGGDNSDAEITAFITDCLSAGQEVSLTWSVVGGGAGSATLLPNETTNAFPNFYNNSVNATGESGEVQTMTGSHAAKEECALRVKVCPEPPAPVVTYDYEFECVDGQLAVITTVTTDGTPVIGSPVPVDPAVDCTNADDFELIKLCATDGFVHIYAYDKSDLSTIVADVTTAESCEVCQPFDIVDYWKLEGGVPGVNGSRWRTNSALHGPVDTMFDGCGNHINGDADEVIVYPNWNVVDTPARFPLTGADFGTSQEYYYSWVYFPESVILEDNNGNTGEFINAYVGGKNQKPVFQKSAANTSGANGVGLGTIGSYPAGLYQIAIEVSDFSVYGGVNIRQSVDGGKTFTAIPEANIFSEPPTITCVKVRVNCDGTMQTLDGLPFIPDAPNCSECEIKCPVIDDTTVPPDYEFQTVLGCDDVDGDPDNFVNVTQETLIVDGVKTVTFYTDYGTDTQAEYTLQGLFVDCATGVPIEDPPIIVDCEDWEILTVYDAIGTNGVNVERWNTNAITGEPVSSVPSDVFTGAPDYSGMPAHDNGAPDGPIIVESDLLVLDQVNDQSQMRGWTYLYTPEPIRLRERHARAEAVDYFLGECCAPPAKVATGPYPNTAAVVSFDVSLPAGIHYVGFEVFDFSAYSGVDYQYSTDNGATWARVPAAWLYTAKPRVTACQMKVCPETGLIADIRTGILNTTASLCEPELCGPVLRSDAQCAFQTFYRINYPEVGTVEQQWTASAVNTSGAAGTSYLAGFTDTDNEGYPAHVNAPDSTISSTIASTTNIVSGAGEQDQAQSDFYIFLTEPTELREFNSTAEASGIWISETCGSSKMVEILDAPYLNQFANALNVYGPGCYRVRLYHSDFSANGVTRLQGRTAGGAWGNITPYLEKPSVSVVKGWACDDGNFYTLDKTETLDPAEYLCEDPRCAPSNCCLTSGGAELPETIGRA